MSKQQNENSPVQPRVDARREAAENGKDRRLEAAFARLRRAHRACTAAYHAVKGWQITPENDAAWAAYGAAVKARTPYERRAKRQLRRAFR
jgi:hypothetical protein